MSRFLHITLLMLITHFAVSQISLSGRVIDDKNEPIVFGIVNLKSESVILGNTITDSIGYYSFKNLKAGFYRCTFKCVSYKDTTISFFLKIDTLVNVQFRNNLLLSEVVVTAKKPILERQIDRLRFNVSGTDIVFGNNVWGVIEKTPLVTVSEDGNIQISGTSGAVVYINDKRKVLSGAALKNYLSSIPSENLEAIEVMTTPPSKYDAEGGAGILNIVLKKNKTEGLIGNAALNARRTLVNSQAASAYFNNRKGKWNIFSNLYLVNRNRNFICDRVINYSNTNLQLIDRTINSLNETRLLSPGVSLGIDHEISSKQFIGVLFDYSGSANNDIRNAFGYDNYAKNDSLTFTNNRDVLASQMYSANINYQIKIDSLGKKLNVDFDALRFVSTNNSVSRTEILDLISNQNLYNRSWFRSFSPQLINNQSLKIDFNYPIDKSLSFDFGVKTSLSTINNDLLFEDRISENVWLKDTRRSNLFEYQENINAIYATINKKLNKKWSYQIGTRIENTVALGWLEGKKVVDRNYLNIFPTAFLRYTQNNEKSYVLSLTSRINRPSFWDVNPFRTYTTDETYFEGNPFLLPSKYYRQELNHILDVKSGTYTFQIASSQLLDEFYALPYNPENNVIANKKINYGNRYGFSTTTTYYNQIKPWWRFTGTALAGYVMTKGSGNKITIDNKTSLFSLSANQTFTLSKKKAISLTVIANNTFPFTIINTEVGNRLETELRLRKTVGNLNITVSVQDLFRGNQDRYRRPVNDILIVENYYNDTRSVGLALSYNFGKKTIKDKRERDIGNADEKSRV